MSGHRKWSEIREARLRTPEDRERHEAAVAELRERQRAYEVIYPPGVPRWFAYVCHKVRTRRCRRRGHVLTIWPSCNRCGQILCHD